MTTLLCIPFAGAGASFFGPWAEPAGNRFHVVPVQLPGREDRFVDQPFTKVADAVASIVDEVRPQVGSGEQVVLFGHSLGAVVAFELALALEQSGVDVARLVVSGSPGPWSGRTERASELSDDAFLQQVQRFAGYEHPALAHPELRELLLPTLRADVLMHEDYVARDGVVLAAPITSLRGSHDELVDDEAAMQWAAATTGSFVLRRVTGGHMYLADSAAEVLDIVAADLDAVAAP
ncbi:thioesterase II family protein [Cellulomonas sp. P5_C5]